MTKPRSITPEAHTTRLMSATPSRVPRVTTIGGGHGQAIVLRALRRLRCSISAVVATADDGGCSGELRREYGMPAPGDLRRCLSALALDFEMAEMLEDRLKSPRGIGRCRGNLVLAERYLMSRSLQTAGDWVAAGLSCVGRVFPASEEPGALVVCDRKLGLVEGELNVERSVASPLVATVVGALLPNPEAIQAILDSDVIIMGPGSFYTSTLSTLVSGEVGAAVCRSAASRLLVLNLTKEERLCAGYRVADYALVLASHLTICSRGDIPSFALLRSSEVDGQEQLEDGTLVYRANVADHRGLHHTDDGLARAFERIFGFERRESAELPLVEPTPSRRAELLEALRRVRPLRDSTRSVGSG